MNQREPLVEDLDGRTAKLASRYLGAVEAWNLRLNQLDSDPGQGQLAMKIEREDIAHRAGQLRDELTHKAVGELMFTAAVRDAMSGLEDVARRARGK